jgi:alpha-methylacyl-CoA racemase
MAGPLSGVRIAELAAIGPVPFAGMLLADLGADVVRVDRLPGTGSPLSDSFTSGAMGRGRRSLAVDLRRPDAAEIVLRLAERSDILIEGFRPGVAERLRVGPADVLARNPALVYGRMTGWGQDGPLARRAGHDITYLAVSGLLHGIGAADGPPVPPVNYVGDFGGGAMVLVTGLLAALLHARATGAGQVVDAAMTEGAAYLGTMTRMYAAAGAWTDEREANLLDGGAPNYRCYACADGGYVAVGALEPHFWAALISALGLDPAATPSPYERAQWPACTALLEDRFRARTRDEWAQVFAPLDACVAPVLTLAEAPEHPHNAARRTFVEVAGASVARPVPRFSVTDGETGRVVVPVGTDTADVLAELGYGEQDVVALRDSGTLG